MPTASEDQLNEAVTAAQSAFENGKKHLSTNVEQSWAKLLILLMHTVTNWPDL